MRLPDARSSFKWAHRLAHSDSVFRYRTTATERQEPEMKALVYHGPGERGWDTVDDPTILDPTDAIVRIDTSTICGTDLHILKGDVPETTPGTVLGHEAVGTVQEVGSSVSTIAAGDRVLMSCVSSCGRCRYCKEGRYGQCLGGGGWIFGHLINGLQAEYARVPFADNDPYGRVRGVEGVHAAGDAIDFPIKHGGIGSQQADVVAQSIAALAGASVTPEPFNPVIHGMLLTDGKPMYLTAKITGGHGFSSEITDTPTWSPPSKIAAKYLAPYLEGLDRGQVPA